MNIYYSLHNWLTFSIVTFPESVDFDQDFKQLLSNILPRNYLFLHFESSKKLLLCALWVFQEITCLYTLTLPINYLFVHFTSLPRNYFLVHFMSYEVFFKRMVLNFIRLKYHYKNTRFLVLKWNSIILNTNR